MGGSEKVNEFPFSCVQPEVSQGHLLWLPVGRVALAPKRGSWARDPDLGGTEAQVTAAAASEELIHLFVSQVFAELQSEFIAVRAERGSTLTLLLLRGGLGSGNLYGPGATLGRKMRKAQLSPCWPCRTPASKRPSSLHGCLKSLLGLAQRRWAWAPAELTEPRTCGAHGNLSSGSFTTCNVPINEQTLHGSWPRL